VIVNETRGYSRHPEVMRWRGKLNALLSRHEEDVREMEARGYKHRSPLSVSDVPCGHEGALQECLLELREDQARKLKLKGCECDPPRV
ncbi:MAG: hypothetical protein QG582_1209, partial [Candidatus Thermoplasmatota archaeon]|nr:hypothetical protein [Candidatus Thermoplasmatota archaeon]